MSDLSAFWTGDQKRCFFIAEIGVNHNGNLETAKQLIDVAVGAGADAVKFQVFSAESLVTRDAPKADYQTKNQPEVDTQFAMLKKLEFTPEKLEACRDYCISKGIVFMATPFDADAGVLLANMAVDMLKVSSADLTNLPLLQRLSRHGIPMILSTGMANISEVEDAIVAIQDAGDVPLALLHCVSDYPADPAQSNLKAIDTLAHAFNLPVGWSDHTLGDEISVAAVARGAQLIEKHFTLDHNMPGPDHKASLLPEELKVLISKIRNVENALGDGVKKMQPSERSTASVARRSIVAANDIPKGTLIEDDHLTCKRPGTGLPPKFLSIVVGKVASRDIEKDSLLQLADIVN